jgi:tetratricopeptide (TPR) repeat protein
MSGAAGSPGAYPGNPSLPREVRDKILSTFRHTLNLFREGKTDDCLIGCDFILKMDPRFGPARQLLEKSRNPAADVDIEGLEAIVAETPSRQGRRETGETDRLLVRAVESLNARDFDAAIATAEQVLQQLPGNQHAAEILQKARQRKGAAPQFDVARQRALAALDSGQRAEARSALEKMRALDPEHPAVALLERRLAAPPPPPAPEVGESTNPGLAESPPPAAAPTGGGLDELSLDSLSLDEPMESQAVVPPPPNLGPEASGPLSSFGTAEPGEPESPHGFWSDTPAEMPGLSFDSDFSAPAPKPPPSEPEPPSQEQEIESLLARGDEAVQSGNRQEAIEIWSRVFLIDINNSEAVTRIEKARQEMAEGNRRIAESLKRGRERFEAGDFTAAREAFLEVLALDENEQTARSYIDRIEQELARPSAGLDLSRKVPQGDILAEEMAEAAAPAPEPIHEPEFEPLPVAPAAPPRRAIDKRFVAALAVAAIVAIGAGAYFVLRPARPAPARAAAEGGPSLEHATLLFRDGKLAETIAELRRISPDSPDYARAQKLLASLTRGKGRTGAAAPAPESEEAAPAEKAEAAPPAQPSADAARLRAEAEQSLADKRYIDALKAFNAAGPAFRSDPTFAQSMAAASEKVSELTPAVKLYNEGEYETAIPILWRIYQEDHENQDARSYLIRCYYNQGVNQLHNGLFSRAVDSFNEAVQLDPTDADAIRNKKFAERYRKGDLDMMGRIYVRHVQQRP